MGSQPSRRRHAVTGLEVLGVALAYCAVAQPALLQRLGASGQVRVLWPAAGIGLAALVLLGLKVWPGITLGSFVTATSTGRSPLVALGIALGTTAGIMTAFLLLRRVGFRPELDRVRDALALVFFGAIVGMVAGAALRTGVLVLAGVEPERDFVYLSLLSWLSSGIGVLVITPFVLVLRRLRWPRDVRLVRVAEATALLAATIAVTLLVTTSARGQLLFLVSPLLLWAAWRFQLAGAMPCALVVSVIAVNAVLRGTGPFEEGDLGSTLITAQAFIASTTLAALFLAVAVTERNQARSEIEEASHRLVSAVERLDQSLRPRTTPLVDPGTPQPVRTAHTESRPHRAEPQ